MVPPTRSTRSAAPFPPPGSPRCVPRFPRYYGAVRLPGPLSADSVACARQYPALRLCYAPSGPGRPTAGRGLFIRSPLPERRAGRPAGPPRFPDNLVCPFALFSDPGRTTRSRPLRYVGTAPAMSTTKAPTIIQLSRLNRTASGLAVYASSSASRHPTQNSLPAAGQAVPGGLGYPQGCAERFHCIEQFLLSGACLAQGRSGFFCGEKTPVPRGQPSTCRPDYQFSLRK